MDIQKLTELYLANRKREVELAHMREDLEGRQMFMAPVEGWPGKNEEQRKIAAWKAFDADEVCITLKRSIRQSEIDMAELHGEIQSLEAERRDLEWAIRAAMTQALSGALPSADGGPDSEFDDAIQAQAENDIIEQIEAEALAFYESDLRRDEMMQAQDEIIELMEQEADQETLNVIYGPPDTNDEIPF